MFKVSYVSFGSSAVCNVYLFTKLSLTMELFEEFSGETFHGNMNLLVKFQGCLCHLMLSPMAA